MLLPKFYMYSRLGIRGDRSRVVQPWKTLGKVKEMRKRTPSLCTQRAFPFLHPLIFENCVANQFIPQIQAVAPNPTLFRPRPFIIQRPMQ